jgi:hypothetical protein
MKNHTLFKITIVKPGMTPSNDYTYAFYINVYKLHIERFEMIKKSDLIIPYFKNMDSRNLWYILDIQKVPNQPKEVSKDYPLVLDLKWLTKTWSLQLMYEEHSERYFVEKVANEVTSTRSSWHH